jgi:hypothetical protein
MRTQSKCTRLAPRRQSADRYTNLLLSNSTSRHTSRLFCGYPRNLRGSAFLRGDSRKGGHHLLHLFSMTIWTLYLGAVVFFDRQDHIKLFVTRLTTISVTRHNPLLLGELLSPPAGCALSGLHTCMQKRMRRCVTITLSLVMRGSKIHTRVYRGPCCDARRDVGHLLWHAPGAVCVTRCQIGGLFVT